MMDSTIFSTQAAKENYQKIISRDKIRPIDGRGLRDHRGLQVKCNIYTQTNNPKSAPLYGSSQVNLGGTIVTAGVRVMVGKPMDKAKRLAR